MTFSNNEVTPKQRRLYTKLIDFRQKYHHLGKYKEFDGLLQETELLFSFSKAIAATDAQYTPNYSSVSSMKSMVTSFYRAVDKAMKRNRKRRATVSEEQAAQMIAVFSPEIPDNLSVFQMLQAYVNYYNSRNQDKLTVADIKQFKFGRIMGICQSHLMYSHTCYEQIRLALPNGHFSKVLRAKVEDFIEAAYPDLRRDVIAFLKSE